MVKVGVIAVDGTKVHANASNHANRDYQRVARDILAEADRIDREEDELYGDARGDELPDQLRTAEGRRAALREAKRKLEEQRTAEQVAERPDDLVECDGRWLSLIQSRSLGASRAAVAGCARPVVSLMSTAGDRRSRFHAHEPSGCWNRSGGCARSWRSSMLRTRRMRRIARVG